MPAVTRLLNLLEKQMLTPEQLIRLQDIGVTACHYGMAPEARKIFDGLLKLRPDNTTALVGTAMSHIVEGEFQVSEAILREKVLSAHPDDAVAVAMLGLCCILTGKPDEARELLITVAGQKTASGQLARDLLAGLGWNGLSVAGKSETPENRAAESQGPQMADDASGTCSAICQFTENPAGTVTATTCSPNR
ncbi:tetratricopeptide repeat protein [Desulfosarcina sp. OttesenSCG-928-G10]|nr:tetratricopeptide repeat protein [Desulfosarcina sp. OttesenSCG-928-G10]